MKSLISCDFYILNLAIIDILMPVFGFPLTIYSSMNHKWVVGEFPDILLLHTKSSIIGIYGYATFWAFLPVFGVGAYGPEPYGTSCTLAWQGHQIFVTFFLIACVILPVIVMNVSYGRILWHIKRNRRRAKRSVSNINMSVKKKDSYLIKMTFAMCVGFVGLWSPYAVVSLWTAYGRQGEVPIRVTLVAVLFAKLSTVVNPSVYFIMNKKFRPILNKYYVRISNRMRRCTCISQYP
ncbi:OPN5 [Mytilus coruscus]|uniref:OPN5 n=1 Tax=Mytilus coruscus TaxID=42192 RepID=A0A6J7ZZ06_MYTCO|nr:OPN5 [Mytilus coruscus]